MTNIMILKIVVFTLLAMWLIYGIVNIYRVKAILNQLTGQSEGEKKKNIRKAQFKLMIQFFFSIIILSLIIFILMLIYEFSIGF
jgi:sterol desaturase/sphingolipid hydroxylase (fatty acid hydroxylase superfamily)